MHKLNRVRWLFSAALLTALLVSVLPPASSVVRAQDPEPADQMPQVAPRTEPLVCADGEFLAKYWNNASYSGTPVLERCENAPLAISGTETIKGITITSAWSARFAGNFRFEAVQYDFIMRYDDAVNLWVDGVAVYSANSYITSPKSAYKATMTAGLHEIKIDFINGAGAGRLYAGWLPTMAAGATCPVNQLRADYWANTTRSGAALFSRCEDMRINYSWDEIGGPYGLRPGAFSARWSGTINGVGADAFPAGPTRLIGQVNNTDADRADITATVTSGSTVTTFTITTELGEQRVDTTMPAAPTRVLDVTYVSHAAGKARVRFDWAKSPSLCNAPASTLVGRNDELVVANGAVTTAGINRLEPGYGWDANVFLGSHTAAEAVRASTEGFVVAGVDANTQIEFELMNDWGNVVHQRYDLGAAKPNEAPGLLSRYPGNFVIFARPNDSSGDIKYVEATIEFTGTVQLGDWLQVPGVTNAASKLTAIAPDANTMLVFYKDISNSVWLAKWSTGSWAEPIALGGIIVSNLTAVAPSPEHVAVFGVGGNDDPYVMEWTPANEPDWSDTFWRRLHVGYCRHEPMAAVAQGVSRITLACRGDDNGIYLQQWNVETGWASAMWRAGTATATGPLTLVVPETGKLWAEWASSAGPSRIERAADGTWGSVITKDNAGASGQVLAVVTQPGWVHHIVNYSNNYYDLRWKSLASFTTTSSTNSQSGAPRGAALVKVGGKTVWVTTYQDSSKRWWLVTADPETGAALGAATQLLTSSLSWEDGLEGLTYGDYDADGDDEVVIFLRDGATSATTAMLFRVDMAWSGATLTRTVSAAQTVTALSGTSFSGPVSAALGDLDGDGRATELVLAGHMNSVPQLWLYEYKNGAFQLQPNYPWSTGIGGYDANPDLQVAVGRMFDLNGEQVALSIAECSSDASKCNERIFGIIPYRFYRTSPTTWAREAKNSHTQSFLSRPNYPNTGANDSGALSTALALGDIDGDGMDEIVYSIARYLFAWNGGDWTNGRTFDHGWQLADFGYRSLALGDVDEDVEAEILEVMGPANDHADNSWLNRYRESMFDLYERPIDVDAGDTNAMNLIRTYVRDGATSSKQPKVALIGDVDDDSLVAELTGCQTLKNTRVLAVVNAPPRYYKADGEPWQDAEVRYAKTSSGFDSHGSGMTWEAGASIEFEYEYGTEISLPAPLGAGLAMNIGYEFTYSWNRTVERTTTVEDEKGFIEPYNNPNNSGMVVYGGPTRTCYTYDVYPPNDPTERTRTMVCEPPQATNLCHVNIDYWNSAAGRAEFGSYWFPVGHAGTAVSQYPSAVPAGYNLIFGPGQPHLMRDGTGGDDFGAHTASETMTVTSHSWMNKVSFSAGAWWKSPVSSLKLMGGVSFGGGAEVSEGVGWSEALDINQTLQQFPNACLNLGECRNYITQQYLATAEAMTVGGLRYPYLVADFIVTDFPAAQTEAEAAPETAVAAATPAGPLPQAPIVGSPTHPDPDTWYTAREVTFDWQQPAGDPATVLGYRRELTLQPDTLPGTVLVQGNSFTYTGVSDGVHYFHIAAASQAFDGDGPATDRTVRVDDTPPVVAIALDPPSPNGAGWYNTPVGATLTVDDGRGSGAALIEYSTDGGLTWHPYGGPLTFSDETAGFTLAARATDHVGHVSAVVQREIKIDLTPPSTVDTDGYGISFARIDQDPSGNHVQLVLGGALNDALSGRGQVVLSAGEAAGWRSVDAVGDIPMPPGNVFSTTMPSLNWIYTPTFEIRGIYPLYGHGIDLAGNHETGWGDYPMGTLYWPPDGDPNLAESRLTASPSVAEPGDRVRFTLGLRNSGVQEAAVMITGTVPSGLTIVPNSITGNGAYDAAARQVRWQVHAAWPNQVQYLTYDATVDASASGQLSSGVALLAYWPGYETDAARLFHYGLNNVLTVAAAPGGVAPGMIDARVTEGAAVGDPNITLAVLASPGAQYLYVKEWTLDPTTAAWTQVATSGWVPLADVTVSADAAGKHISYPWTLTASEGVHYLGVWVGNNNQQPSNLNEAGLIFTNLIGTETALPAGQRTQYRLSLRQGGLAILTLATTGGDADLFVWPPRGGFKPAYWSNAAGDPPMVDAMAFYAPESGDYLVEVHAVTDATFALALGGALRPAALNESIDDALPASVHDTDKPQPEHPLTLSTPLSLTGADAPGEDVPFTPLKIYLPLIGNGGTVSGPAAPVVPDVYPARERTR